MLMEIIAANVVIAMQGGEQRIARMVFVTLSVMLKIIAGYFICSFLTFKWIERIAPKTFLRDDCDKVLAYGFAVMMLIDSLVFLTGNFTLLYILYFGIGFQYYVASKYVLPMNSNLQSLSILVLTTLTIAVPKIFHLLFKIVLPKAPL